MQLLWSEFIQVLLPCVPCVKATESVSRSTTLRFSTIKGAKLGGEALKKSKAFRTLNASPPEHDRMYHPANHPVVEKRGSMILPTLVLQSYQVQNMSCKISVKPPRTPPRNLPSNKLLDYMAPLHYPTFSPD